MADCVIDFSEYEEFFEKLQRLSSINFKVEFKKFMESCAFEFLTYVQNEIISRRNVDTGLMVNSFQKGALYNIWHETDTGYEVGSNVEYAGFVNDGHHSRGGGRWIDGSHYWDAAKRIAQDKFPEYLQRKFDEWMAILLL